MQLFAHLTGCIIRGMNLEQEKALIERAKNSSDVVSQLI